MQMQQRRSNSLQNFKLLLRIQDRVSFNMEEEISHAPVMNIKVTDQEKVASSITPYGIINLDTKKKVKYCLCFVLYFFYIMFVYYLKQIMFTKYTLLMIYIDNVSIRIRINLRKSKRENGGRKKAERESREKVIAKSRE